MRVPVIRGLIGSLVLAGTMAVTPAANAASPGPAGPSGGCVWVTPASGCTFYAFNSPGQLLSWEYVLVIGGAQPTAMAGGVAVPVFCTPAAMVWFCGFGTSGGERVTVTSAGSLVGAVLPSTPITLTCRQPLCPPPLD